jgi:hypothetical protein
MNASFKSHSPYKCAQIINEELAELKLPAIPPQMMYNYVKKGYVASFVAADGKIKVNEIDLANWFTTYLAKKQAIAAAKASLAS